VVEFPANVYAKDVIKVIAFVHANIAVVQNLNGITVKNVGKLSVKLGRK